MACGKLRRRPDCARGFGFGEATVCAAARKWLLFQIRLIRLIENKTTGDLFDHKVFADVRVGCPIILPWAIELYALV